ncbi:transcriptional regulator BetI [Pararhizobium mangrovi]|uniref:Transcriptional regulator BetI n=2 Tax=Pararhizobium mangrovi TaxID=2590452 RepID=A0A506U1V2_9HYPH|nr:transcriptional regulator BetI [Pararhizobium mangrovi]TPW27438.1 transcriptional regulator BetI [Pararhizobium mangrovi]
MKSDPAAALAQPDRKGRKASKEVRRQQLIDATIDSLARRGYSETTMANVADGAGLSRGIVNFHFESKDKLLVATLQHMAEEYAAHWRSALARAGDDAAEQLFALVSADFDRAICNRRKLAAWCAFWGEAKSRPTYQALCGQRDEAYQNRVAKLCTALIEEGGYRRDPGMTALGLDALLEGLWLRLMLANGELKRETARDAAIAFLRTTFPDHFSNIDGSPVRRAINNEKKGAAR